MFGAIGNVLSRTGGAIKDSWVRATELADAAKGGGNWKPWGKGRWITPEFGAGEFLRGFIRQKIHHADATDPVFMGNLKKQIERDVKANNQGLFNRDFQRSEDLIKEKEEEAKIIAEDPVAALNNERKDWLDKTRNSPAAQAGFSDDQRWALQQKHRDFKAHRKAGTLDEFAKQYPDSVTARERNIRNRIPTSMDMEY